MTTSTNSTNRYDDIINLKRPELKQYPRMSIAQRSAQFAPYKTITIYHDQIENAEKHGSVFTEAQIIPNQDYHEYQEDYSDAPCADEFDCFYEESELDNSD